MLRTIGLMSGTSLDGVDAAYLETDGETIARLGPRLTLPYDPKLRRALRALLDRAETLRDDDPELLDAVKRLTDRHAEAVEALGLDADLIGFHGQTILHRPPVAGRNITPFTWQVGDAVSLARRTGMTVAYDFRSADVAAGGQGAPLVPVFHRALAAPLPKPLAILNLGGVGNVTWLGPDGEMLAFDTGPANGPLDDWARQHTGKDYDAAGKLALAGQADGAVLGRLMSHPYLTAPPPKSLDRLDFDRALKEAGAAELSAADGAATLCAFCAVCVAAAARLFPEPPLQWLVAGGGRRNPAIMKALAGALEEPVRPVEVAGWDGDALEAQAFGLLAARVARKLPITFPGTTGVPRPLVGGRILGSLL
ncbi:anhydro-N-acetylmuramic acid kinase [Neoroseomonas lacus]|uniref:Anhydro-N-acetylmuramic acid kinase n=1 Tax=Neoroseomonas lacus TaxID=287609 RepID=A0A917KT24_9PROT|nr:anhydro-N-acetylmuramic acid kinase [Neoroseomonas lacus]